MLVSTVLRRSCADHGAIPKRPSSLARRIVRATAIGAREPSLLGNNGPAFPASAIGSLMIWIARSDSRDQTILQWTDVNSPVHLAISFGMDGRIIQAASDAVGIDQLSGARR